MSAHPDLAPLRSGSPDNRRAVLGHVRRCAECRARLVTEDPVALFGLLAVGPMPAAVLDEVAFGVGQAIRRGAPEDSFGASRRMRVAVAWVAAALLAGSALTFLLRSGPENAIAKIRPGRAGVEVLSTPGSSHVVDLAVGDTQLVMIFDKELDL